MVKNNAGGYTFTVAPAQLLQRFLVLGTAGGTYYANETDHTQQAYEGVKAAVKQLGVSAVDIIKQAVQAGAAPRISPILIALAICLDPSVADAETRSYASASVPDVVRTNSQMLEFVSYLRGFRGGGRLFKETVGTWYNSMPAEKLAYQLVKYRNRANYTTRDVLRLARPVPIDAVHSALYGWATKYGYSEDYSGIDHSDAPKKVYQLIDAFMELQESAKAGAINVDNACALIQSTGLTHEMLPTELMKVPEVWEALLPGMPMTAMIRNLGRMSSLGLFTSKQSKTAKELVLQRLNSGAALQRAKIHPFSVLLALTTYRAGEGFRGSLTWVADKDIVHSLDAAFYASWKNVVPANKRTLLAVDVSGSMSSTIMNTNVSCRTAATAMALVTQATEPNVEVWGFSHEFKQLRVDASASLESNETALRDMNFGSTDCSLPFTEMARARKEFDTVVIYTDNETYAGQIHPSVAMERYKKVMGIDVKCVVVGMTATRFTIADPRNPNMLDVVGFDASAPALISAFSRGDF